jgi:predicted O-methyltransferase YrrM
MMHSVKTGESAFGHLHGANVWEWRSKQRDETEIFDAAMSELSGAAGRAIASGYDFSVFNVIVDVGSGQGALLAAVLAHHKNAKGILFDLPHVVVKAQEVLRAAGVTDRCEIVGGDVFKAVPEGGDAYLIKSVLMDEDDDQAIAILKVCRSAMRPSGKVIVVEQLLTPPNGPEIGSGDMTMMIMTGGRERSREEFSELLSAAGFHLEQVVVTKSPFMLMIGAPV